MGSGAWGLYMAYGLFFGGAAGGGVVAANGPQKVAREPPSPKDQYRLEV